MMSRACLIFLLHLFFRTELQRNGFDVDELYDCLSSSSLFLRLFSPFSFFFSTVATVYAKQDSASNRNRIEISFAQAGNTEIVIPKSHR
jgi:hypothetical protein